MKRHKAEHLRCKDIQSLNVAVAETKKRIIGAGGTILDVKIAPPAEGATKHIGIVLYAI